MKTKNKVEKIIKKSLELYDDGVKPSKILELYPFYKNEIKGIFQTIKLLNNQAQKLEPPKELLENTLSQIQISEQVTKLKDTRYIYGLTQSNNNFINNLTKIMNRKIYIAIATIALVILVAGGTYLYLHRNKTTHKEYSQIEDVAEEISSREKSLEEDVLELMGFEEDKSLDNLEQELNEIAEELI